jgi:hypothetical protein
MDPTKRATKDGKVIELSGLDLGPLPNGRQFGPQCDIVEVNYQSYNVGAMSAYYRCGGEALYAATFTGGISGQTITQHLCERHYQNLLAHTELVTEG